MVIPTTICWFSTKKPLQQSVRPSLFIFSPFPSLSSSEIKRKEAYVFVRQIARSCEERKYKVFLVVVGNKRNVDPSSWNEGSQTVSFAKRGIAFEEVRGSKLPEQEQDRQQPKGFFTTLQSRGRVASAAALLWRRNIKCLRETKAVGCVHSAVTAELFSDRLSPCGGRNAVYLLHSHGEKAHTERRGYIQYTMGVCIRPSFLCVESTEGKIGQYKVAKKI